MSSSSSSSSSGIGHLQTSNLLRLTGTNLMSGLDTDSIIKALVSRTQSKIDKQGQLEQIATWKRDMYRDVTTSLKTFSNTYFSYVNGTTNILSSSFFNSTSITSSSSAVSATGNATNAKNMTINSISQLASAAAFNSSLKASNESITSGTVYDNWVKSSVGGKSVVVTYNGKDYTLNLSNSVMLDSHKMTGTDADSEIQKIADGLNDQINANDDLKGKLQFKYNVNNDGEFELDALPGASSSFGIKAYQAKSDDTSGMVFLAQLGFGGATTAANGVAKAGIAVSKSVTDNTTAGLFNQLIPSSSELTLNYGGESYTVNLGMSVDTANTSPANVANAMVYSLNKSLSSIKGLSGKVIFAQDTTDLTKIVLKRTSGTDSTGLSITGASENLQQGFGMATSPSDSPITIGVGENYTSSSIDPSKLTTTYLGDALQGSTLTFNLDGLQKNITFDANDESAYETLGTDTPPTGKTGLIKYLQDKVDSSFGSGKISVDLNAAGTGLSIKVADPSSVLKLTSSDGLNVLNQNGALRIYNGDSNRIGTGETLADLVKSSGGAGEFSQRLQAGSDGTYKITINGETLSFSGTDTVGDVMTKINDDAAAGVTVSYSQTTDTFRIISSDTGSQGKVNVSDATGGGNLAEVLFGFGTSSLTDTKTGSISADSTGKITDTAGSSYTFTLGSNTQTVSFAAGTSFKSISDLATQIQNQLNTNSAFKDKVNIGIDGNQLTFNSVPDPSNHTAPVLNITTSDATNVLNIASGSTGISTVDTSQTLSTLATNHPDWDWITKDNSTGKYYVKGYSTAYDGTTQLSAVSQTIATGTDLKMNISLNGNTTGTDITRSSNSFMLDGVTITVNSKTMNADGTTVNTNAGIKFTATNSTDDLTKRITDFVTAYNAVIAKANTYTTDTPERDANHKAKYQPLTDDQKADMTSDEIDKWNTQAKKGLLQNDNTLNGLLSDLNAAMGSIETSSGLSLSQIGISTVAGDYTSGGQLGINTDKLKSALATEPDRVQEMFTNATDGIAKQLTTVLDKYAGTSGGNGALIAMAGTAAIPNDQSEMSTEINQYGTTISNLKNQLSTEEDRWWSKFSSMEQSLSVLNSQMGYLNSMNGSSSSSS